MRRLTIEFFTVQIANFTTQAPVHICNQCRSGGVQGIGAMIFYLLAMHSLISELVVIHEDQRQACHEPYSKGVPDTAKQPNGRKSSEVTRQGWEITALEKKQNNNATRTQTFKRGQKETEQNTQCLVMAQLSDLGLAAQENNVARWTPGLTAASQWSPRRTQALIVHFRERAL